MNIFILFSLSLICCFICPLTIYVLQIRDILYSKYEKENKGDDFNES